MIHFWLSILGILAGWLLFRGLPFLHGGSPTARHSVTVIIPARNEAGSIGLLLADLAAQTLLPAEIIVVDDMSTDGTGALAGMMGARVITVDKKPEGWVGKSYACELGAKAAQSGMLLFLDADVRLAGNAVESLLARYERDGATLSVQPYHTPGAGTEQLALFFNLIAVASLASPLQGGHTKGLFGPCILMSKTTYLAIGGHASVKGSIIEDMSLGEELAAHGLPSNCLLGGGLVRFRMYAGGVKALFEGFAKNFASGAAKSSFLLLLLVIVWVSALCRAPIGVISGILDGGLFSTLTFLGQYLLLVSLLYWAGRKVGQFKPWAALFYPVPLLFFVAVFCVSIFNKFVLRRTVWKGRSIGIGKG